MSFVRAFALFWYDFIVGDSWVLAIGTILVLAIGALLAGIASSVVAEIALPAMVLGVLAASLPRR